MGRAAREVADTSGALTAAGVETTQPRVSSLATMLASAHICMGAAEAEFHHWPIGDW